MDRDYIAKHGPIPLGSDGKPETPEPCPVCGEPYWHKANCFNETNGRYESIKRGTKVRVKKPFDVGGSAFILPVGEVGEISEIKPDFIIIKLSNPRYSSLEHQSTMLRSDFTAGINSRTIFWEHFEIVPERHRYAEMPMREALMWYTPDGCLIDWVTPRR